MKVLVVEDDELNRKLLKEILEYGGYEVLEASGGKEAVELAEKHQLALVLIDINMPEMDGVQTLRRMRQIRHLANTPMVAVTAFAMKGDRENFLSEGFDDYITKPYKIDVLLDLVNRIARVPRTERREDEQSKDIDRG